MEAIELVPWVAAAVVLAGVAGWLLASRGRGPAGGRADEIARLRDETREAMDRLAQAVTRQAERSLEQSEAHARNAREELRDNLNARIKELVDTQAQMNSGASAQLETIRKAGDEQIGKLREMVDEKLRLIHERAAQMTELAQDVGRLKAVLSSVRTRGLHGEFQLEALLEESLSPGQYRKNVALGGAGQVVEFAICLPNRDGSDGPLLLPLDSKFPLQPYESLLESADAGNPREETEARRKAFVAELKRKAREIAKYISPPRTTDFALMFLPVEGMYAEALRTSDTWNEIRAMNVVIVGPTTLYALLQSLLMGFKSIAISEHTAEAWAFLREVASEFRKFDEAFAKCARKLEEAAAAVESVEKRSQIMRKKLHALSDSDAPQGMPRPGSEGRRPEDPE